MTKDNDIKQNKTPNVIHIFMLVVVCMIGLATIVNFFTDWNDPPVPTIDIYNENETTLEIYSVIIQGYICYQYNDHYDYTWDLICCENNNLPIIYFEDNGNSNRLLINETKCFEKEFKELNITK